MYKIISLKIAFLVLTFKMLKLTRMAFIANFYYVKSCNSKRPKYILYFSFSFLNNNKIKLVKFDHAMLDVCWNRF